jgi:hypothetical protein
MRIFDARALCDDGRHQDRGAQAKGITIHMFGVEGITDAAGVARWMKLNPQWTGGQMCYTVVVGKHRVELALPWWEVGPHALRWSSPTIGVVAICDFNLRRPTNEQWALTVDVTAELINALGLDPMSSSHLAGHTERPDASKSKGKVCPGKLWDLDKFRRDVRDFRREAAIQRLETSLVVR